ncbi:MAG: Acetyltransferase (GNAT) family protein [Candidatus Izimaplasma bacterium HR2]|nr:MAG: Acetyltransferase (GNAT) family protein [Candidatus Izimaplasma bacterium HR2]
MSEIEYSSLLYNEEEILNLYENMGWSSYTKDKESLFKGIKNSIYVKCAYDAGTLVGLVRAVGDGNTIIYIQDILVLESYQREGIGSNLIKFVLEEYKDVRQICLTTDITEKQRLFYESIGFKNYESVNIKGFMFEKQL